MSDTCNHFWTEYNTDKGRRHYCVTCGVDEPVSDLGCVSDAIKKAEHQEMKERLKIASGVIK